MLGALMQSAPSLKQALVDFVTWQPGYSNGAIVYLNRLRDEYELRYETYAVSSPETRVLYDIAWRSAEDSLFSVSAVQLFGRTYRGHALA